MPTAKDIFDLPEDAAPDAYEYFNVLLKDVFTERTRLLAFFTTMNPAVIAYNDKDTPEWPVLYVKTPTGQMTWHIAAHDMHLLNHVPIVAKDDERAQWDGHTSEEKYKRLQETVEISVEISNLAAEVIKSIPMDGLKEIRVEGVYESDLVDAGLDGEDQD